MKKQYSLDYNIQRDVDRVAAVYDILDQLQRDPNPTQLQQMGSYILYGKDVNGYNAVQRGEITNGNTRYNSFKKKDDTNVSLDEILDNPMANVESLKQLTEKRIYTVPKPSIKRPRYNKETGEMIDPGDSDIPGMTQLWQSIDRLEKFAAGTQQPEEGFSPKNSYRLYQLKHWLIDLRRHQYYLKDAYKPEIHFTNLTHPRAQFIDWSSDCAYWLPFPAWQKRVNNALLHTISKNISDYETRTNPITNQLEVRWIVRRHTFDWENYKHVAALINQYDLLYDTMREKFQTYGRTFIFDFQRYTDMANLNEVQRFLLRRKIEHAPYSDIITQLRQRYNIVYNENHLSAILARNIPKQIANAARKYRINLETPQSEKKRCFTCKQYFPKDTLFFGINNGRKDHWSSNCKDCEKKKRIARGGQTEYDRRRKDTNLSEMPPSQTSN